MFSCSSDEKAKYLAVSAWASTLKGANVR
jgi:hypothetical protein